MLRLLILLIGYGCGLLQTGYLYAKSKGIDIYKAGSGNVGSTNSLRVFGKKAAAIVFAGDLLKCFLPCLIVKLLTANFAPSYTYVYLTYMAIGAILGHNYPIQLKFKGGKGIACSAGFILALDWRISLVCLAAFVTVVGLTRFVSVGSLMIVTITLVMSFCFGFSDIFGIPDAALKWEFCGLVFAVTLLAFWRHRANIRRLAAGTENRLGAKSPEPPDTEPEA